MRSWLRGHFLLPQIESMPLEIYSEESQYKVVLVHPLPPSRRYSTQPFYYLTIAHPTAPLSAQYSQENAFT